jgi:hypothetical protein
VSPRPPLCVRTRLHRLLPAELHLSAPPTRVVRPAKLYFRANPRADPCAGPLTSPRHPPPPSPSEGDSPTDYHPDGATVCRSSSLLLDISVLEASDTFVTFDYGSSSFLVCPPSLPFTRWHSIRNVEHILRDQHSTRTPRSSWFAG